MSSLYVVDGNAVPFSSAQVTDVLTSDLNVTVPFNGGCIVSVQDWLTVTDIDGVFTFGTGLIDKKYAAMLANYPGFTQIVYDALLDAAGLDLTVPGTQGQFGERGTNRIAPAQTVTSTAQTLGFTPSTAVVIWELFSLSTASTSATEKIVRTYTEKMPSDCTCEVSFNGGSTWLTATSGGVLTVPAIDQGTSLVVRFSGAISQRYLGGWAVIY